MSSEAGPTPVWAARGVDADWGQPPGDPLKNLGRHRMDYRDFLHERRQMMAAVVRDASAAMR